MRRLPRLSVRGVAVMGLVGVALAGFTLACRPATAPPAPTSAAADPFVVVRATAEAAFESGQAHLNRGELEAALVDLDTARTNDADNRQDIQDALASAIDRLAAETPTVAGTAAAGRTLVVATVPAVAVEPTLSAAVGVARPSAVRVTTLSDQATLQAGSANDLVAWSDPQGRFSVGAPTDWRRVGDAEALFGVGTGVVQFRDPGGRAELDVAVDPEVKAVSPEVYSAGLEIALQQQVPGYAAEQMLPDSTSGNPSIRRVFTFTQRDSAGHDLQARGFQVVILKGSTPYVISGSAPTGLWDQASPTFDRMVQSFRFS